MVNLLDVGRRAVTRTVDALVNGFVEALPRLVTALVFVAIAYVAIRIVLLVVRSALEQLYPKEATLVVNLGVAVVAVFLWFGVALSLLKIVGMGDIAASLGTATGFIALGISYALSDMIGDVVAGIYLLRDPDFTPGDRISTDDVTGELRSIELRKSRFRNDEGETVVVANGDIEDKWHRIDAVPDGKQV